MVLSSNYGVFIFPLSIGCNVGCNIGSFCLMNYAFGQILCCECEISSCSWPHHERSNIQDIEQELDEDNNSIISGLTCKSFSHRSWSMLWGLDVVVWEGMGAHLKEFHLGTGVTVHPCIERVMLIRQNMGYIYSIGGSFIYDEAYWIMITSLLYYCH